MLNEYQMSIYNVRYVKGETQYKCDSSSETKKIRESRMELRDGAREERWSLQKEIPHTPYRTV